MKIYSATETDFNNNGYGILRDTIYCSSREFLNGQYDIKFIYPADGYLAEYIIENNIVKVDNGRVEGEQLFRIKMITKNLKEITVIANHITFDLENNFLVDVRPTNLDGAGALNHMLTNTQFEHSFTSNSDIELTNSATYIRQNVITALINDENGFCKRWNAELLRDNFLIYAKNLIGENRGIKIQYGRNLKGLYWDIDMSQLATRIMPQGTNELLLPELFIDSPFIDNYPSPVVRKVNFNTIGIIDGEYTEEEAQNLLRNGVQELFNIGIDVPIINLEIDMVDLSKTTIYKDYSAFEIVRLGDTVTANLSQFNITDQLKVIGVEYDCLLKKYAKFYLSNSNKKIINNINELAGSISAINSNLNEINNLTPKSVLNKAQETATDLITNALGGYVVKTQNELLIMDTDDVNTAEKVWRWNQNGLGYSANGINGPYELAMTSDGQIVADFIKVGILDGALIQAGSVKASSIESEALITGGTNLISNSVGFFGDDGWENAHEGYTNTEIKQNTTSQSAWRLKNRIAIQTIQCQNKKYTLSYKYKKMIELAECKIEVNGEKIELDSLTWNTGSYTFETLSNTIEIKVTSDTDNACFLSDLMLKEGIVKSVWSGAAGESVKGGVKIGSNIELTSSGSNIMQKIDNDGNRIINTTTGEVVAEYTDKGLNTNEIKSNKGEIAKVIMVDMGNQTWISRL